MWIVIGPIAETILVGTEHISFFYNPLITNHVTFNVRQLLINLPILQGLDDRTKLTTSRLTVLK